MRNLLIIILLTLSTPLLASVKTETELKLNLTKAGFDVLKKHMLNDFDGEESKRFDYYFDIFQDRTYYLQKTDSPIKLRFQDDGDVVNWQVKKTESQIAYSIFSIKTTNAITSELDDDSELLSMIKKYHKALEKLDPSALTLARSINAELKEEDLIRFSREICEVCSNQAQYFSTHMNQKKRIKIKLELEDDKFTVQLGETNNRGVLSYEIEAEVKKSKNVKKSAELLKTWLISQGLKDIYIDHSEVTNPTEYSEALLNQLYPF